MIKNSRSGRLWYANRRTTKDRTRRMVTLASVLAILKKENTEDTAEAPEQGGGGREKTRVAV